MNSASALKNTKNGVFALITNGVGGNFSIFTVLASIVINASILPPIYYFFKLIKARYQGSKASYERHNNVVELVRASPNIRGENGPIIDPRKEKGVMAGKASMYRLTCVIGSISSLPFSILSLYSFISSLRFKNQMNAWGISFALLSSLVAAVTIFLQIESVSRDESELIEIIAEGIGINRPSSTTRDVHRYYRSEPMVEVNTYKITTDSGEMKTNKEKTPKPYYYSFRCVLSLSFAAFAQLIAVYTLPNTMRIPAFVVCTNLCFALSKSIFDAYYAYQCNIYDEKNRVIVIGETIQESDAESSDERSLLQIRLAGTLSDLREALKTKLDEVMKLLKQRVKKEPGEINDKKRRLVKSATLLSLALNSLKEPDTLAFLGLAENIAGTAYIAMHIMHRNAFEVYDRESAVYSTEFNGRNPAILKAEACSNLKQPLEREWYIYEFRGDRVKMENQHLCYDREEAASLMNGEIDICRIHNEIGPNLKQKVTVTSLELVALILAAKHLELLSFVDRDDGKNEILETIKKVAEEAGETIKANSISTRPAFRINTGKFLMQLEEIDRAFQFELKEVAKLGA